MKPLEYAKRYHQEWGMVIRHKQCHVPTAGVIHKPKAVAGTGGFKLTKKGKHK